MSSALPRWRVFLAAVLVLVVTAVAVVLSAVSGRVVGRFEPARGLFGALFSLLLMWGLVFGAARRWLKLDAAQLGREPWRTFARRWGIGAGLGVATGALAFGRWRREATGWKARPRRSPWGSSSAPRW